MKNTILIILFLTGLTCAAQTINIAAAKASFAKSYPSATKVKWEKENGVYEVSFIDKGNEMSATYDGNGKLLETEQEISVSELPASVTSYMHANYKGSTLKGAAKITKADGTVNWEAALKGKDALFDANGKFLREVKD